MILLYFEFVWFINKGRKASCFCNGKWLSVMSLDYDVIGMSTILHVCTSVGIYHILAIMRNQKSPQKRNPKSCHFVWQHYYYLYCYWCTIYINNYNILCGTVQYQHNSSFWRRSCQLSTLTLPASETSSSLKLVHLTPTQFFRDALEEFDTATDCEPSIERINRGAKEVAENRNKCDHEIKIPFDTGSLIDQDSKRYLNDDESMAVGATTLNSGTIIGFTV